MRHGARCPNTRRERGSGMAILTRSRIKLDDLDAVAIARDTKNDAAAAIRDAANGTASAVRDAADGTGAAIRDAADGTGTAVRDASEQARERLTDIVRDVA